MWKEGFGVDSNSIKNIVKTIKEVKDSWIQVAIVTWAWNFIRGASMKEIDRCAADNMGMLAITINGLALQDALEKEWIKANLYNSLVISGVSDKFEKRKAVSDLEKDEVVIISGGTGNPYFTTDTAWVLRALELDCDMIIKATQVDGLYDKDPNKFDDAKFIETANYDDVLEKNLRVMDQTAFALAREESLEIRIVSLKKPWAILKACKKEKEGTVIKK